MFVFFFKQKTAYEMRISDWSSDVCSSDLDLAARAGLPMPKVYVVDSPHPNAFATGRNPEHAAVAATTGLLQILNQDELAGVMAHRSEEHTSELQSLMRISYAVFCLNKKTHISHYYVNSPILFTSLSLSHA